MEINTRPLNTADSKALTLSDNVFDVPFNEDLVHQAFVCYQASGRSGTQKQKNRSEVSGGGKKPWRQKGTGRARAGSIRSPIWTGGGTHFAARPRDYTQKINKKMYKKALTSIISELIRQNRVTVVDAIQLGSPKTKAFKELVGPVVGNLKTLVVLEEIPENVFLACRNLVNVEITDVHGINPVNLIDHEQVIFSETAVQQLEEKYR